VRVWWLAVHGVRLAVHGAWKKIAAMIEAARMFPVPPSHRLTKRIDGFKIIWVWWLLENYLEKQAQLPVGRYVIWPVSYFVMMLRWWRRGIAGDEPI
jgi:hypothetical protein